MVFINIEKRKESIIKAIEELIIKDTITIEEKKNLDFLLSFTKNYVDPGDNPNCDAMEKADGEVFKISYKHDYEKEIDPLLCSWLIDE